MKIEIDVIKKMLESARDEGKKKGECDNLDRMFNFGIDKIFFLMQTKLFDAEMLIRGSEK